MDATDYDALVARYGEETARQIVDGQAALAWARRAYAVNHPERKPASLSRVIPKPKPPQTIYGNVIKVWPAVILAAVRTRTAGAARLYFLARQLDHDGRGLILRADLVDYLRELGVNERNRQRWTDQAVELGIIKPVMLRHVEAYALRHLGYAAVALGAERVGLAATTGDQALTGRGWRSWVWAAYLTTTKGRPISQEVKAELTGIKPRTQRHYQSALPGTRIRNVRHLDQDYSPQLAAGMRELGMNVYADRRTGGAVQTLPDGRLVPLGISQLRKRGNSRAAQRFVNASNQSSLLLQRRSDSSGGGRLFCETENQVSSAIRQAQRLYIPDRPAMVFQHQRAIDKGRTLQVNTWRGLDV